MDTVFDFADVRIDRHQGETDPAGHLRDTDRNRTCGNDIALTCGTLRPEDQGTTDQQHRQDPRQSHQSDAKHGRQLAEMQRGIAEPLHRAQRGAILVIGMGEQLDRLDVGDRVDDLARYHRTRARPLTGAFADTRQEPADQQEIGRQPDDKDQRDPRINRQKQEHRPDQ